MQLFRKRLFMSISFHIFAMDIELNYIGYSTLYFFHFESICWEVGAFSFQYYQVVISVYLNANELHLRQGDYSKYLNARLSLDT